MQLKRGVGKSAPTFVSLLLSTSASVQASTVNNTQGLTGFIPCDALIGANLSHLVLLAESPLYPKLVNGSWTADTQRTPWCFALPGSTTEVSQVLTVLSNTTSAGKGAGDWAIAVRSGGHGGDDQNSITNGIIVDLSYLNATTYNEATKVASLKPGSRWGAAYSALQEHGVSVTGGRQSIVGVGGLLLGGGVGWTTPRTGFGCDQVVNYEVVLANGSIVNANATAHSDLWRALKGGSSNFGIVTRFDLETFPASNLTLERRTVGPEYADDIINGIVGFANAPKDTQDNALVVVIGYQPAAGEIVMTVTEVNSVNDWNTTAFNAFNKIPLLSPSNKQSYTLPDAAAIDAPELAGSSVSIGAGPQTIANHPKIVQYCFQQHEALVTDLNSTLGPANFSTILEFQPLPTYFSDISVSKGGNMLGLENSPRNKLYFALGAMLSTPASQKQAALVYQKVSATQQKIKAKAKELGLDEDFIYLPYADATQDALASYGVGNVRFMKGVAGAYDPTGFFQSRVPGGFKISRVV